MKRIFTLLLTVLLFSVGCQDRDDNSDVFIRIVNQTSLQIDQVLIDEVEFINIAENDSTDFQPYNKLEVPTLFSVKSGEVQRAWVIDYVAPLPAIESGLHTYTLTGSGTDDFSLTPSKE